jgi:hypothetical protein
MHSRRLHAVIAAARVAVERKSKVINPKSTIWTRCMGLLAVVRSPLHNAVRVRFVLPNRSFALRTEHEHWSAASARETELDDAVAQGSSSATRAATRREPDADGWGGGRWHFGQTNPRGAGRQAPFWPNEPGGLQAGWQRFGQTNPRHAGRRAPFRPSEPKGCRSVGTILAKRTQGTGRPATFWPKEPEGVQAGGQRRQHFGQTNPTGAGGSILR